MEYVFIPQETLNQFKINKDHYLTPEEVVETIVHKKLIKKLLLQRCFAIQEEIGTWQHRWDDELYHRIVEELSNVINFIDQMEQKYDEYEATKENK